MQRNTSVVVAIVAVVAAVVVVAPVGVAVVVAVVGVPVVATDYVSVAAVL